MLHKQTAVSHIHARFILIVETGFHFLLTCLCHLMQSNHGVRGLLVTEKQNRVCQEWEQFFTADMLKTEKSSAAQGIMITV